MKWHRNKVTQHVKCCWSSFSSIGPATGLSFITMRAIFCWIIYLQELGLWTQACQLICLFFQAKIRGVSDRYDSILLASCKLNTYWSNMQPQQKNLKVTKENFVLKFIVFVFLLGNIPITKPFSPLFNLLSLLKYLSFVLNTSLPRIIVQNYKTISITDSYKEILWIHISLPV